MNMSSCDRCGKVYEYEFDRAVTFNIHIAYPHILQDGTLISLCPDCQEELKTWIEKGINNGKTQF